MKCRVGCLIVVGFLSGLVSDELAGQEPQRQGEKPPGEAKGEVSRPRQASLEEIRDYQIVTGTFTNAAEDVTPLIEIVNPFEVKKRGRFYGSVYAFHRNDNFDARNFFDPVGEPLPEFKRNQFGFTLGMSVSQNLFFSGSYDGLRIVQGSTLLSHLPTRAMKKGDFRGLELDLVDPATGKPFPNNIIPESRVHPVSQRLLLVLPDPNLLDPERNFINSDPRVENQDTYSGRFDYNAGDAVTLAVEYRLVDRDSIEPHPLPRFGSTGITRNQDFSLNYSHTFSQRLVNSLQLSLSRDTNTRISENTGKQGLLTSLGISGLTPLDDADEGFPEFNLTGYGGTSQFFRSGTFGDSVRFPDGSVQNRAQLNDFMTLVIQNHTLTFGGELEFEQLNNDRSGGLRRGRFEFNGFFTGDAFADFLLGLPDSASRAVGSDRADLRGRRWKLFFRDDWRLNQNFSVSFTMGYNYFAPYRSIHNNVSIFFPALFEPPLDGEIVVTGSERARQIGLGGLDEGQSVFSDRNDWEPRIGLAYSPWGNNETVFRASYQISYNPVSAQRVVPWFGRNFPFYFVQRAESSPLVPELDLARPFESLTPTELTVRNLDPFMRNEYIQEWRLSLERQIKRNWNLELTYVGRKATRVSQVLYGNAPEPGPGTIRDRRPNPNFGLFQIATGRASSSGNSLEVTVRKRLSAGFSLRSGFTWNRTFDDRYFGHPANPRNLRAERGLSGGPTKRFFVNYIFDLPFGRGKTFPLAWMGKLARIFSGWRLSGITRLESGRPFGPRLPGDPNNDGMSGDRPDRIGSGTLPSGQQSVDTWFNVADFAEPPAFTFGDSGTNFLFGPPEKVWDLSLTKVSRVGSEGQTLEFRVEFFNAFNHPNFDNPNTNFGTSVFGTIFGAGRAREIEIALKYSF